MTESSQSRYGRNTFVALLVLAGACGSGWVSGEVVRPPSPVPARFKLQVATVSGSEFERHWTVMGPLRLADSVTESMDFRIRSFVPRDTGQVTHQLYVQDAYYGDWIFWDRANAADATALEFASISRDVKSCVSGRYGKCHHAEIFGASIADTALRDKAATGYAVKFYARTGRVAIVTIPPEAIAIQLAVIDSLPRKR